MQRMRQCLDTVDGPWTGPGDERAGVDGPYRGGAGESIENRSAVLHRGVEPEAARREDDDVRLERAEGRPRRRHGPSTRLRKDRQTARGVDHVRDPVAGEVR